MLRGVMHLAARLPLYHLQRSLGASWLLPASYTVSVLHECNSRCKTCRVYQRPVRPMTAKQIERFARSVDQPALWLTVTGGEPFLRADLDEVVDLMVRHLGVRVVTLPTNGSLPGRLVALERLASAWPARRFVVNLSLDELGPRHDELRGHPGVWSLALESLAELRRLQRQRANITVGIHTVISRFNEDRFPAICDALLALAPDSYIVEVAGQRAELGNDQLEILPSAEGWRAAIAHLGERLARAPASRMGRLVRPLRAAYYRDVDRQLSGRAAAAPCFAGTASCHILPDGEVVACGVRSQRLGHLAATGYSFPAIWRGPEARQARRAIAAQGCRCTLANQAYLRLALDPAALMRIAGGVLVGPVAARLRRLRP
jgi:MoaA/NifB/PqqE/SkfB family radical SAM enzyme